MGDTTQTLVYLSDVIGRVHASLRDARPGVDYSDVSVGYLSQSALMSRDELSPEQALAAFCVVV